MSDPITLLALAGSGLVGLVILTVAGLVGWRGWLDLQKLAIAGGGQPARGGADEPSPAARIELADLRERVRRLEAIAAGVDP